MNDTKQNEKLLAIFIEERDKFAIAFCEYMEEQRWREETKRQEALTIEQYLEIFKLSYNKKN